MIGLKAAVCTFLAMVATNIVIDFVDRPPVVQETAGGPR
jgi:hypothetical protein